MMGFITGAIVLTAFLCLIGMVDEYPSMPEEEDSTWLEDYPNDDE